MPAGQSAIQGRNVNLFHTARLRRYRELTEQLARFRKWQEKSQPEFSRYIDSIKGSCKYEVICRSVVSLCQMPLFSCRYRGTERFHAAGKHLFECRRSTLQPLKNIL